MDEVTVLIPSVMADEDEIDLPDCDTGDENSWVYAAAALQGVEFEEDEEEDRV